jgi:Double-GTPase 2
MWLIGAVIVLAALYFSFMLLAPATALVTAMIAAAVVIIEFATATAWVFRGTAPINHLSIEPPLPDSNTNDRDPAYRSYFFGPVFRDYALAMQKAAQGGWERAFVGTPTTTSSAGSGARQRNSVALRIYDHWLSIKGSPAREINVVRLIASGPMVGGVVGVGVGAAAAAVFAILVSMIFGLLLGLILISTIIVAGTLRLMEQALLQIRGITLECGSCHRRVGAPVYSCPDCSALHRKLIPGPFGVFSHLCRCQRSLKTLLVGGKWNLRAYCQHCNKPLPDKGLTAPTVHIPVVAGQAAGKTVYMMASVASLKEQAEQSNDPSVFEFADPRAEKEYLRRESALKQAALDGIRATLPEISVQAFNIYVGPEGSARRRLLYLYDAAGERYQTSDGVATFRFLGHTEGVILIVDPFSFEVVRRFVTSNILAGLRYSEADADEVLGRFSQTLRENLSVRTDRKVNVPVAVVLTKCDGLLAVSDVPHPYDELGDAANDLTKRAIRSNAVRHWLESVAGQHSLLATLENTFERYSYFSVSALDAFTREAHQSGRTRTQIRHDDTAAPLRWLLDKREA